MTRKVPPVDRLPLMGQNDSREELPMWRVIALIASERQRQEAVKGWTPEHDDEHEDGELANAALCYIDAALEPEYGRTGMPHGDWPWEPKWWNPSENPMRNLVKAAALIVAEIERLERAGTPA